MKTEERYLLLMLFIYRIIDKKTKCCVGVHLPCGRQCVPVKLRGLHFANGPSLDTNGSDSAFVMSAFSNVRLQREKIQDKQLGHDCSILKKG